MAAFTGKDMVRVVRKIHSNLIGSWWEWRAVWIWAGQRMEALAERELGTPTVGANKDFRRFMQEFDKLVELTVLLDAIPEVGWIIKAVRGLYRIVTRIFPI